MRRRALVRPAFAAALTLVPGVQGSEGVCHATPASESRWYGAEPHTPLAIVSQRGIREAGPVSCDSFAVPGTRWLAVDVFGQVVGHVQLAGSERYDVTGCREASFRVLDGSPGVGLYASESGIWQPPSSARWDASDADRTALSAAVQAVRGGGTAPAASLLSPVFLRAPKGGGGAEVYAVVGGPVLLVMRSEGPGKWSLAYREGDASAPAGQARSFRPLAAFDMDGDGVPEIVFHEDDGDSWQDGLLKLERGAWRARARSIHGSTA